jgi:hypothetical protein
MKTTGDSGSSSFQAVPIMPSIVLPAKQTHVPEAMAIVAGCTGSDNGIATAAALMDDPQDQEQRQQQQQQPSASAGTASNQGNASPMTAFASVSQADHFNDDVLPLDLDPPGPASNMTFLRSSIREGFSMQLSLKPSRSLCTYKTKALATAAAATRLGPAASTLRLAGTLGRSSSGSLADALLSEMARAESGLLTAALPRSDSLPHKMADDAITAALAATDFAAGHAGASAAAGPALPQVNSSALIQAAESLLLSLKDLDMPQNLCSIPSLTWLLEHCSGDQLALRPDDLKTLQAKLEQQGIQPLHHSHHDQAQLAQQEGSEAAGPAALVAQPAIPGSTAPAAATTDDVVAPTNKTMAALPDAVRQYAEALCAHENGTANQVAAVAASAAGGQPAAAAAAAAAGTSDGRALPQLQDLTPLQPVEGPPHSDAQQPSGRPLMRHVSSFAGTAALEALLQQEELLLSNHPHSNAAGGGEGHLPGAPGHLPVGPGAPGHLPMGPGAPGHLPVGLGAPGHLPVGPGARHSNCHGSLDNFLRQVRTCQVACDPDRCQAMADSAQWGTGRKC